VWTELHEKRVDLTPVFALVCALRHREVEARCVTGKKDVSSRIHCGVGPVFGAGAAVIGCPDSFSVGRHFDDERIDAAGGRSLKRLVVGGKIDAAGEAGKDDVSGWIGRDVGCNVAGAAAVKRRPHDARIDDEGIRPVES